LNAVMPDVIPEQQRGKMSGFLGLSTSVAFLIGTFATQYTSGNALAMFVVPWLLIPIAVTLMLIFFKDSPAKPGALPRFSLKQLGLAFWINPVKNADFGWAFLSRFLVFLVFAALWTRVYANRAVQVVAVVAVVVAGAVFYGYTLTNSTGSTEAHVGGFTAAFTELPGHPMGRGMGNVGVLASLFDDGSGSDVQESGLGVAIAQLGV
ncbi:hypothetical protein IAE22_29570, partial [Bacillus sp. S34]|nr:hypothetical protein [Bacillus sp. S34]